MAHDGHIGAMRDGPDKEIIAALRDLSERLGKIEARLDELERKLERPEEGRNKEGRDDTCTECSSLVGCLEDCCDDPEELRKRVKDVRSSDRGH